MRFMILLVLNIPTIALAASGGDHGELIIPFKLVVIQAINLTIAIGLLIYLTRKAVVAHFKARHDDSDDAIASLLEHATNEGEQARRCLRQARRIQQIIARLRRKAAKYPTHLSRSTHPHTHPKARPG